ncbi:hypothetical protein BBJ28_00019049 [Nothophytophthora sp. Chile5]|nr:hypothetical protein BBJ28_00019049 [Nothophytophthora sp. Chile5]
MAAAPAPPSPSRKATRNADSNAAGSGEAASAIGLSALRDSVYDASSSAASASSAAAFSMQTFTQTRPRDPPPCERAVVSRTRLQITLPSSPPPAGADKDSLASSVGDHRGWSSPHGEPYRPLGRPELSLKFTPRLATGVNLLQNTHRMRVFDGGGASASSGSPGGAGNNASNGKDMQLREPSACASITSVSASVAALADLFPVSPANHKRSMDERQTKLACRLQASISSYSPEKIRGLHRRNPTPIQQQPDEGNGGEHHQPHRTLHGDASLGLLREAIEECTGRLRAARNGTNFLQQLPPPKVRELHELQEQYLQARTKAPPSMAGGGTRASTRLLLGAKAAVDARQQDEVAAKARARLEQDDQLSLGGKDDGGDRGNWYLPYTTRQLQRSPHRRLPSVREFRPRARDDKQPMRPLRSVSITPTAATVPNRTRTSTGRAVAGSFLSSRSSVVPPGGVLNPVDEHSSGQGAFGAATAAAAVSKVTHASFRAAASCPPLSPVPPMHSVEKLLVAVDALETAKCEHSARLAMALDVLEQDRRECLASKFLSLQVHGDAVDDLRRMRARSERHRGQRVRNALAKTASWYPELLRRLLAREAGTSAGLGTAGATAGAGTPLHAAELFVIQAVRCFSNDGHEFGPTLLFEVVLHLHHDDLGLPSVQQLLAYLRNALHIEREDWDEFVAAHDLPELTDGLLDDRKESGTAQALA